MPAADLPALCDQCDGLFRVTAASAGQKVRCPHCRAWVRVAGGGAAAYSLWEDKLAVFLIKWGLIGFILVGGTALIIWAAVHDAVRP